MEIVRNFVVTLGHSLTHAVYSSDELTTSTLFNNARKVGGFVISRTYFTDAASAQDGKCCSRRLSGKFHGLTVLTPEARGRGSLTAGLDEMTNIVSFEMYVLHNNPGVFVLLLRLDAALWKGVCTFANDVTSEQSAVNMPLRGRNVLPSDVIKGFATWLCGCTTARRSATQSLLRAETHAGFQSIPHLRSLHSVNTQMTTIDASVRTLRFLLKYESVNRLQ